MKVTYDQINCISTLVCSSIVAVVLAYNFYHRSYNGFVDVQALVTIEAEKLAKKYPKGDVPENLMEKALEVLKIRSQQFSKEHGVNLLVKGAIWSGAYSDYTDRMIEYLKEEE